MRQLKRRNPIAQDVKRPLYRMKVVPPKKGRGAPYKRAAKQKGDMR